MSKHTPGPWGIDATAQWISVGPEGRDPVADIQVDTDLCTNEEHWANAHLIAAAPELLSLLKQVMAGFEEHGRFTFSITGTNGPEELVPYTRLLLDVKAAISKATGEPHA